MSYLKLFAHQDAVPAPTAASVFGGMIALGGGSERPPVRIAISAFEGMESLAMGTATCLRYLLGSHEDIETIPAYYSTEDTNQLHSAMAYEPHTELRNQLTLCGKVSEDFTLSVVLDGLIVRERNFTLSESAPTAEALMARLPFVARALAEAIIDLTPPAGWLTQLTEARDFLAELWDVEDALISAFIEAQIPGAEVEQAVTALIKASAEQSVAAFVLGQMVSATIARAIVPGTGALRAWVGAAAAARNDTVLASLLKALIEVGKSTVVIDELDPLSSDHRTSVQLLFADAALYTGSIQRCIEHLQALCSRERTAEAALGYADRLRYLFEADRLDFEFAMVFSQHQDVTEEIEEAYRYSLQQQPSVDVSLRLVQFQCLVDIPLETDVIVDVLGKDHDGLHVEQLISDLAEDERIEQVIEAVEAAEPLNDLHLLGLARMYLELKDQDAARECVADVQTRSGPYFYQVQCLAEMPDTEIIVNSMALRVASGGGLSDDQIDVLETIVALNPYHETAYAVLGQAYAQRDDLPAAAEVLVEAAERIQSPALVLLHARLLWDAEQHDKAVETLVAALPLYRRNGDLPALLALYVFAGGHLDEAREFLRRADFLTPDSVVLAQVRSYIGGQLSRE